MKNKRERSDLRLRKKNSIRKNLRGTNERPRLSVFKSAKFTYAQIISDQTEKTLASASTREQEVISGISQIKLEGSEGRSKSAKGVLAARALGQVLAKRAKEKNIGRVVFDRNGFLYSGRIQAVADGAREGGLDF